MPRKSNNKCKLYSVIVHRTWNRFFFIKIEDGVRLSATHVMHLLGRNDTRMRRVLAIRKHARQEADDF